MLAALAPCAIVLAKLIQCHAELGLVLAFATKRRLTLRFIVVDRALLYVFKDQSLAERLQTRCAMRLPFACQSSMTVPIRSVLASGLLANYSMQASIRLHETRRTRAAGSGDRISLALAVHKPYADIAVLLDNLAAAALSDLAQFRT
jgi:hypothetical protein